MSDCLTSSVREMPATLLLKLKDDDLHHRHFGVPSRHLARMTVVAFLATIVRTAHARTPITTQALNIPLRQALPARRPVLNVMQRMHYSAHNRVKISSAPKGFIDLVGDRSPLSSDPELATESASWTPASPWFASQNLTALFPIYEPGSGESHAFVAHETTSAVQAALWASQNPPDCSKARYLVLEKAWHSGFGSAVHIHTRALALAIR